MKSIDGGTAPPSRETGEGPSFDQWRAFVAVVEAGSFSAAGRQLGRVQSAISHAVAALEDDLGLLLFDRSPRIPVLTSAGQALVPDARRLLASAHAIVARAHAFAGGVEARVVAVVDALFPMEALVAGAARFRQHAPDTELVLRTEALSVVTQAVRSGAADVGVASQAADVQDLLTAPLGFVRMIPAASPTHPLAALSSTAPLTAATLAPHVQIVLSERAPSRSTKGGLNIDGGQTPDQGVLSGRTWRVVDLETKEALIAGGLGWGNLPEHRLRRRSDLKILDVAAWNRDTFRLAFSSIHRPGQALGPASALWLESLQLACADLVDVPHEPPTGG